MENFILTFKLIIIATFIFPRHNGEDTMPFLPTNRKRKQALLFNAYGEPELQGRSFENCEWLAHSFLSITQEKNIYISSNNIFNSSIKLRYLITERSINSFNAGCKRNRSTKRSEGQAGEACRRADLAIRI